jgi:WD40 repeat protein
MILAGLKDGTMRIYDIRTHALIHSDENFKGGEISSLAFNNKGLHFAMAQSASDIVRIFNLRKLQAGPIEVKHTEAVSSVAFDHFGQFMVTGSGQSINVYGQGKNWIEPPVIYQNPRAHDNGAVKVAKFSQSGRFLVSGGIEDRFLKVFSL